MSRYFCTGVLNDMKMFGFLDQMHMLGYLVRAVDPQQLQAPHHFGPLQLPTYTLHFQPVLHLGALVPFDHPCGDGEARRQLRVVMQEVLILQQHTAAAQIHTSHLAHGSSSTASGMPTGCTTHVAYYRDCRWLTLITMKGSMNLFHSTCTVSKV